MLRNILAGTTALALVIGFAAGASANPENEFGDSNTAAATAMADANANSRAVELGGVAGVAGGAGGKAATYAESFNSVTEVISVQEMTATVNGAPIVVFGVMGCAGIGGALSSGATTVTVGAGTFGGIANVNVASGYLNSAVGGVSSAMNRIE